MWWGRLAGIDPFDQYLTGHLVPEHELLPELPALRASGLVCEDYHQINVSGEYETTLDPVLHYLRFGWRRGARPNGVFDPGWYVTVNLDVARLRINPLMHYILEGEAANRRPVVWFDPGWYRSAYDVPVAASALAHYLLHRHSGAISPNVLFDVVWYQERYGAMIPPGVDPFSHYLTAGAMRDIDPSPRFSAASWRHRHMAPREARSWRDLPMLLRNPLVHHMTLTYGTGP